MDDATIKAWADDIFSRLDALEKLTRALTGLKDDGYRAPEPKESIPAEAPVWLPRGLCWVSDYNPEPGIGCDIAVIVDTCEGLHFPLGGKRAGNPWAYAAPLNDTEICRYHGGMYLAKDGKVVGDIGF